jgi:hypothetical protein
MLRIEEIVGAMDDEFRYALEALDDERLVALAGDKAALRRLRPVGVSHAEALAMIAAIQERRARPAPKPRPKPRTRRKSTAKPVIEPVIEPEAEPVIEPEAEILVEPVIAPSDEPLVEPAIEPLVEIPAEPADALPVRIWWPLLLASAILLVVLALLFG